jgi:site-specific recombinase XerD
MPLNLYGRGAFLWNWCRRTACTRACAVMKAAKIQGPRATSKGLWQGFGVNATVNGVTLNKIQKWLGHADLKTTAIYAEAAGAEEDRIAECVRGLHG